MPSRKDRAEKLAAQMLAVLESLRAAADGSYPPSAKKLAERADSNADWPMVTKAIASRGFSSRALISQPKHPDALVAFVDDVDILADNPCLLEQLLEAVCTPEHRAWPISKLKARLALGLRARFEQALRNRIGAGQLPPSVGSVRIGRTLHLFLRRLPYIAPERALAERMVAFLEVHRDRTANSPLSLRELTEQADPRASAALVKRALKEEPFRSRALIAFTKPTPESFVARLYDLETLANTPRLLEALVASARTATTPLSTPTAWKRNLDPRLWPAFQDSLTEKTESGTLPPTLCWLKIRGKPNYFLRADLNGGSVRNGDSPVTDESAVHVPRAEASAPLAQGETGERTAFDGDGDLATDFTHRFEAAFERLNRMAGGHNFVSLFDLRRQIAIQRDVFDAGLRDLRFQGRYTLSAAEGRHGLRPEERDAGITEDGTLLLYVARRKTP